MAEGGYGTTQTTASTLNPSRSACVQVWDARSLQRSAEIPQAHAMPVRDVDFARQEPHKIATAGDEGKLRFWDLR